MPKGTSENANGFVRWRTFITVIISVVLISGGVGVYALNANKEFLHPDAVRYREIEPISRDITELKNDMREIRKMVTQLLVDKK